MKRTHIPNYDWVLFSTTLTLTIIGILFIYSSGIDAEGRLISNEYLKQIVWSGIGLILMLAVSFINYTVFLDLALPIYLVLIILLIVTLLAGSVVNGARSWLGIASFGVQPSEFMKISVILLLALYLERTGPRNIAKLKGLLGSSPIIFLPIFLVLLQPDFGTAMVYVPIAIFMLYSAGANPLHLLFIIGITVCTVIFIVLPEWERIIYSNTINFFIIFRDTRYFFLVVIALSITLIISIGAFFTLRKPYLLYLAYFIGIVTTAFLIAPVVRNFLQDHQMMRLLVFLNPNVDPRGAGWSIIQSVTAVGSGGFSGKGFLAGTHSHFQFLPQQSTDFIFSILAEEWGFIGGLLIIVLYGVIVLRCLSIAYQTRDRSGRHIAVGICAMLFFHFTVSVGMAIGVMPITGIPLLFLSYGGSSLWTAMVGMGLLISISRSRIK